MKCADRRQPCYIFFDVISSCCLYIKCRQTTRDLPETHSRAQIRTGRREAFIMKLSHWEPDLRTITSWIENGEIDLQPNFQRGDIWPLPKKRKLIDTVLRGWSIPPIHVVVTPSGTLEVLDGQQRLTSIRDFVRGD